MTEYLLIETGTGISQSSDGYEAGKCAAHDAMSGILQFPLSVVMIYTSAHYNLELVLAGVNSVVGSVPILGTTTAGEICQGFHHHSVTVVAIASPHLSVHAAVGNGVSTDWKSALNQAIDDPAIDAYVTGKQHLTSDFTSSGKSLFAMIFYPGNTRTVSSMGYEILETFKRISLGRIPVFGGASADDWRMESNSVFLSTTVHTDSLIVAIFESQLEVGIGLSHGFIPIGEKMTVIASEGHELISLDHAAAADTIANRMGKQRIDLEGQHLTLTTGFSLGSPDPMSQYSVNVASYFTPRGGVRMTQPVSVGTELRLLTYDADNSILAGQEALRKSMIRAGTNAPALILVHYCALRSRIMGETLAQIEMSKLQEITGAAKMAGFLSFGEDALADDGISRHNNGAVAVLVLGKQFSATAKVAQENKLLLSRISEHERAEAVNLSRVMFENSPSGMVAIDPVTGLVIQANNRCLNMFGYSKDELLTKTMLDVTHPEDRDRLWQYEQLSKGMTDSLRYEKRLIRKDSSFFWAEINLSAFKNRNGKISLIIGNAVDITERKQAEVALKSSKDQLAAILNATMESIILVDIAGIILSLNDTAANRFQLKTIDMLGNCIWNFVPPELVASRRENINQAFITGIEKHSEDTRNGYHFSINYYPIKDNDAKVNAVVIYAADITKSKKAEEALIRSELRLRTIIEKEPECINLVDRAGNLLEMNAAGLAMLEASSLEEVRQKNILDYVYPEDHTALMYLHHRVMQGESGVLQFKVKGLHGTSRYLEMHATPLRISNSDETLLLGITRDITEQKQAEQAEKRLGRAFRLLSRCSTVLVHAKNEVQLLADICQLAVDIGGYRMAWVGFAENDSSKTVRPVAFSGYEEGYLKVVKISWDDTSCGRGPVGTAINSRSVFAIQDIQVSPQMAPWREQAIERGYQSCVSLPLIVRDQVLGAMTIYSAEPFAFANEEMELLKELATDLSYGIAALRTRIEHDQALIALEVESEKTLALLHNASDGIHILDADRNIIEVSDSFCAMLGYRRDEVIGMNVAVWDAKYSEDKIAGLVRDLFQLKSRNQFETLHKRKDGTLFEVEVSSLPLEFEGQAVLFCSSRDISERKQHEQLLRANELQLMNILNNSPIAVRIAAKQGRKVEFYNRAYAELIHNPEANGDDPKKYYVNPADYEDVLTELAQGKSVINRTIELLIPGKGTTWSLASYMPMHYRDEVAVLGWFFDITDRKHAEEALRITASVFDNTQEAIIITDSNHIIIDVNPAFTQITGYSREEALGNNSNMLNSGRQDKSFYTEMWQALNEKKVWRGEILNRRKSGEIYAELLSINAVCNDEGMVLRYVGGFSDISHIKAHEAELARIAHYDALTGIPNRVLLADRMKQAIAQTSRDRHMMAICYLDLDGFKPVNDTLGHDAGDHVLIEVARRIGCTIRGGDTVARLGGDEFVVLLQGLEQGEECVTTLERMLAAISQPIAVKGKSISLSASIGVSLYPLDEEDPDTLLRHSDHAMYVAKQSGKNRFHIYDPAMDRRARDQHDFLKSIRYGLENDQFELYYQPKINLRTRELVGAEALLRWRHPERGLLAPAEFLRSVENTELDIEFGEWVTSAALAQVNQWRRERLDIEVSINISGYHLESPLFTDLLKHQLARYPDMPKGRLQIEVLETVALNDIAIVKDIIESCRAMGVGFALDDFGTGYSSLSYLSGLPVDTLKIDQSFVRDMLDDKGDMAIVQGIIVLAKAFERRTVAEGIETVEHYTALLNMGCEAGQGYGIARPMPADKLPTWYAAFKVTSG